MSHIRNVPNPWDDFLSLNDTPSAYTGVAGQFVRINDAGGGDGDALEFTADVVQKSGSTMTGFLTLHADPTNTMHAVTKQYVDGLIQGLDIHPSVRVVTTAADGDLDLAGIETIDGVLLVAGDRVLVRNQTDASENGIYVVVDPGAWTRATDADSDAEVTAGMYVFVEEGTLYADTGWLLSTNAPVTLGITNLTFIQFSAAGTYTAGNGLTLTGTEFAADFEDTDGNINAVGTQDAGTSNKVARADHVHAHGDQAGGTLHDEATTLLAGFLSASDKLKLDAILAGLDAGTLLGQTLVWDGTDTWEPSSNLFNDVANSRVGVNTATPHSTLQAAGSFAANLVTTAVSYDLSANPNTRTVIVDNAAAATVTLPSAVGIAGREYHIKKVSATGGGRTVTIDLDGAETVDGAATFSLSSQYEAITVVSDGTGWWIV